MKIKEILNYLERKYPLSLQENWDNSGLQVGNIENELEGVLLSLDLDEDAIKKAKYNNCNLIINHHPFIFSKIRSIDFRNRHSKILKELIKEDISVFAMHTNLDKAKGGVNDNFAKILELNDISNLDHYNEYPMARYGYIKKTKGEEFGKFVKEKLHCKGLIIYGDKEKVVSKIALCGGAGSEFLKDAIDKKCDAIVTSDIKYHEAIDNCDKILIIDPGHFASENHIISKLKVELNKRFDIRIFTSSNEEKFRNFI